MRAYTWDLAADPQATVSMLCNADLSFSPRLESRSLEAKSLDTTAEAMT